MRKWTYFESGTTFGWRQIQSGLLYSIDLPNPTEPVIEVPEDSTIIDVPLADGSMAYLYPEVHTNKKPITLTYQYQSGPTEMLNIFNAIHRNNRFFKVRPDVPDEEYTGKISNVRYIKIPHAEEDYRDIVITIKQIDE